ncbi:MAG: HDOD domain-containing protein, partial [Deltaproteobacteria bacterium]|nr:HDOD domain-containing protein [Deltaproteobacteria bacterium]
STELVDAAASLAELLAWPSPHVTVVPGARRPGPCVAIPVAVVLQRADEVSEERLAMLSMLADPTEIHVAAPGAVERPGDVHERSVLEAIGRGVSPFAIVPMGHGRLEIGDAILRLLRRRAIVRLAPTEARRASERPTQPGSSAPSGPIARLIGWARSSFGAQAPLSEAPPPPSERVTRPSCPAPGWRASEERDLGIARVPPPDTEWTVSPWDRDRAAIGTTATTVADRMVAALALEMASADASIEPLLGRLRESVQRGLEDVPPISPLPASLRAAIASEATAREVAAMIEADRVLASAVLREGSAAAFGRAPESLEHAVIRIGLSRVHRLAVTPLVRLAVFDARSLGPRALRIRMASQLAASLAAEIAPAASREDCFLAGLTHGLGRLYLATLADRSPGVSPAALEELACDYQSSIGVLLTARWGFGRNVAHAVGTHADETPQALDGSEGASAAATLRVAQIVACAMTEETPVPEARIARALNLRADVTVETGPLLDRARALLVELR